MLSLVVLGAAVDESSDEHATSEQTRSGTQLRRITNRSVARGSLDVRDLPSDLCGMAEPRVRTRRSFLWSTTFGLATLLLACRGLSDSGFTDSKANRERALAVSRSYLAQHRLKLLAGGGVAGKGTVSGGSLRGKSKRAFEVSLAISGASRVTKVVVYVYDADGLVVAGAQSRDKYGAVVHRVGGRLDRSFTSRD